MSAQRGLTLVELLVVLVIMALLGAVILGTLPAPVTDTERAARRFAARLPALTDEAVTRGRTLGLEAGAGLRVMTYADEWKTLRTLPLTRGMTVRDTAVEEPATEQPQQPQELEEMPEDAPENAGPGEDTTNDDGSSGADAGEEGIV